MHLARSPKSAPVLTRIVAAVLLVMFGRSCHGEEVRLLETDRAALQTRLQLIESATQTLDVAYFIVQDDCISQLFLRSLRNAARRGVCVRLIVDSMFNDIDDSTLRQLLCAGVRVREYHPLTVTKPFTLSRRMHDKILIRDGVEMVVGSRNIEDAHFGISVVTNNFTDIDLYVTGSVLGHANVYYQCLWESEQLGDLELREDCRLERPFQSESSDCDSGCSPEKCKLRICRRDAEQPDPMKCCCQRLEALMAGELECRREHEGLAVSCVKLLHDPRGKKDRDRGVRPALYEILDNAQCSIVLQSPYIIPARELGQILRRAARRGVCIRILTNSLHSTNQTLAYSAFSREAPECARAGVQFWEYGGPNCLHAKSFVVDGRIACITSFNFDSRSAFLNTELATVVCDEVFAAQLTEAMDRNFCEAYPMQLEGRQLVSSPQLESADPARVRQARAYGSVYRLPGVNRVSETSLRFLQGFSILIQRQL